MKKETENNTPAPAMTKEERAAASAVRKEKEADYRAKEKAARDTFSLKTRARKATVYIAKSMKTGKVTAAFARLVVRMGPSLSALAEKPAAVTNAVKRYEEELEKDKDARQFKAPSKGILQLVMKVMAEGWEKATACDKAADEAAQAFIATL